MTVSILQGDVRAMLATLPDAHFDCIVTDPPYGETSLSWDRWVTGWPALMRRVLKPTGTMWVFGSQRMFFENAAEFEGWRIVQDVVWEKHNGSGFIADRFKRVHEFAVQFALAGSMWRDIYKAPQYTLDATPRAVRRKKRPTHTGNIDASHYVSEDGGPRLMRSVIYCRSEHGRAVHPTQKPLEVVSPLIRYACPPNGKILDPFAGSGTTALAAKEIGAQVTLIEANPEYVEIARRRIEGDAPLLTALS